MGLTLSGLHCMSFGKFIMTCLHHYSIIWTSFIALNIPQVLPIHSSSSPQPLAATVRVTVSSVLPYPRCRVLGMIQYVAFSVWALSLNDLPLSLRVRSFLLLNNILLSEYTSLFIHSSTEGCLGCFHVLAVRNNTAINIRMQVFR